MVPDTHNGDLGIEAFGLSGNAYQCYAAEEPLEVGQRYAKQRDKLTIDLGKLKKNSKDFKKMLGEVKIRRYVFLVHQHDSRLLIDHAQTKTAEVKAWNLPFIDEDFHIVVETLDDYQAEIDDLHAIPRSFVQHDASSPEAVEDWTSTNISLVNVIENKLAAVVPGDGRRAKIISSLTKTFLEGSDTLEKIETRSPELHEAILRTSSQQEDLLVLKYDFDSSSPYSSVADLATDLGVHISRATEVLDSDTVDRLAWMTIADWLMRCPLDFGDE